MKRSDLFKCKPTKELFIPLLSWALVVGSLFTAFRIFTTDRVALNFITFGFFTILIFGIGIPLFYTKAVRGQSVDALGITKKRLSISLLLGVILTVEQYILTFNDVKLPAASHLIPLVTMLLAVGLFENIFFRGFVQLEMEKAFGIVPSLILVSILYALYHIGYGMAWGEMYTLFYVGLVYALVFRLTKNIFVLYPLLTPAGALYTNLEEGLELPFEATYGFVIVIVIAITLMITIHKVNIKSPKYNLVK